MGVPLPFLRSSAAVVPAGGAVRASRRQRAAGLVAALVLEGLVVLALLTLGTRRYVDVQGSSDKPLVTFDLALPEPDVVEPAEPVKAPESRAPQPAPATLQPPEPLQPPATVPAPSRTAEPPPLVRLPPAAPSTTLPSLPAAPTPAPAGPRRVYGPPAPSGSSAYADTPVVEGSGPNGEKLYAAAWQREPYDSELRGYLSTAQGPGWGLIACRTVADFRVEDCVALGESPRGSQIARAVLAAAWQFRVRPPRVGGRSQVGEWVRIRIDYGIKQRAAWEEG